VAVRRRAELQPFPDAARTEPGLSRDIADRGSGLTESVDLIKDGLPRAAMRLLGEAPMLSDIALIVWARDDRRPAFALIFRWRQ
jgi:hypothetical protein